MTVCIVANTIVLCMDAYKASEQYLEILNILNNIFVAIFAVEAFIKLVGLGPRYYFYFDWNKFDFVIVLLSAIPDNAAINTGFNLTALRIIRVARLLRMIKASKTLQALLKTLYLALNNIANVGMLFLLILFTFTVAGMDLFGDIEVGTYEFIN